MKIGKENIDSNRLYFIADIGANHDGDLLKAKDLIQACAESGADAAKFQNFSAEKIVSKVGFDNLEGVVTHQSSWKDDVYTVYQKASVNPDWTEELKEECKKNNVDYFTSPYDFEAVDKANSFVDLFKIGSGDITWHEIIHHVCRKNKPVILATGASELHEVTMAVEIIQSYNLDYVLMQCNTNYTGSDSNFDFINLNVLKDFSSRFPDAILGLSDHTYGHASSAGAVALGARFIEKHFTLDNASIGPDHKFAMNPISWREMVAVCTQVLRSLGDGNKKIESNEQDSRIVQRRSLRARNDLQRGHIITSYDIESLRPCPEDALAPYESDSLIGRELLVPVKKGECFKRSQV